MSAPRFSVVIPVHRDGLAFRDCVAGCLTQDYDGFSEVIVVSDRPTGELPGGVRFLLTGAASDTSPAEKRDLALQGRGQVVGITGEAGRGKSRLVGEAIHLARRKRLRIFGGACQSYGTNISYLVWGSIWRGLFRK